MPIPRLHLFELEDLPWFPHTIRDLATDYLYFLETHFALHRAMVPLVREALAKSNTSSLVDLCSGGGGPVLAIQKALTAQGLSVPVILTDKYPNLSAFRRLADLHPRTLSYVADSCDAQSVPPHLVGLRTMFNAFHHFAPPQARAVLHSAVEQGQPIGIFEIPERRLATILPLLFTPLFVAIATPFIRPFQWRRLFWTYLLPLVPLTSLWDGLVSQFRAYTVKEMLELTRGLEIYDWKASQVNLEGTAGRVTYLLGIPKRSRE